MSVSDNLPAAGWISTLGLSIAGFIYWLFTFIASTRASINSLEERLERLEDDLGGHLNRMEAKLDKVILHIAGMRNAD